MSFVLRAEKGVTKKGLLIFRLLVGDDDKGMERRGRAIAGEGIEDVMKSPGNGPGLGLPPGIEGRGPEALGTRHGTRTAMGGMGEIKDKTRI